MPTITVTARIASTLPVKKYGGVRLAEGALRQIADALNAGGVPMSFDHSSLRPLDVTNVTATVVGIDDGEAALDATFDIDEQLWRSVEQSFAEAGVPGGFSFTASESQLLPRDGAQPVVAVSADAAVFTDAERSQLWTDLGSLAPTEVSRLYQFSAVDLVRVIVEIWPQIALAIGLNLTSSLLYDGLKRLLSRRTEPTTIEILRHHPDGSKTNAVITTANPEVIQLALDTLAERQEEPTIYFEADSGVWLPMPPGGSPPGDRADPPDLAP